MPTAYVSDPVYDQAFVVTSGAPLPMLLMASAIQWNEDYAVTAKHTPFLPNVVHEGLGDVVFFKHKASKVPQWRQFVPGESVTAVGFNSLMMPVKGKGHTLDSLVRLEGTPGSVFYSIHDGPITKGMSGGPVFADDGKVVGMNVAFIAKEGIDARNRPDLADKARQAWSCRSAKSTRNGGASSTWRTKASRTVRLLRLRVMWQWRASLDQHLKSGGFRRH
jgi:hypothetical protein